MSVSEEIVLSAPAKLTLSLRVTGVRADGYHFLDAEMVSIDLADTLVVKVSTTNLLSVVDRIVGVSGAGEVPTDETNLVARALRALGVKADVRLEKRIPPGAGLGGGSADAAAILRWAGKADPEIALSLGSDVPFCVRGGRARVRGIGEIVDPLPHEDRRFVLLVPPLCVSTAAVYRAWDALRASREDDAGNGAGPTEGGSRNDLEGPALEVEPRLARWRDRFEEATAKRPSLAGSGAVWFVEGEPEELALAGLSHLEIGSQRGALVPVRTIGPAS